MHHGPTERPTDRPMNQWWDGLTDGPTDGQLDQQKDGRTEGGPLSNTIFLQNLIFPLSNTGVTQWFLDTKKVLLRGK